MSIVHGIFGLTARYRVRYETSFRFSFQRMEWLVTFQRPCAQFDSRCPSPKKLSVSFSTEVYWTTIVLKNDKKKREIDD